MTRIESRLVETVSQKLGCSVEFVNWESHRTGDIPIFAVPRAFVAAAVALGLKVESL